MGAGQVLPFVRQKRKHSLMRGFALRADRGSALARVPRSAAIITSDCAAGHIIGRSAFVGGPTGRLTGSNKARLCCARGKAVRRWARAHASEAPGLSLDRPHSARCEFSCCCCYCRDPVKAELADWGHFGFWFQKALACPPE